MIVWNKGLKGVCSRYDSMYLAMCNPAAFCKGTLLRTRITPDTVDKSQTSSPQIPRMHHKNKLYSSVLKFTPESRYSFSKLYVTSLLSVSLAHSLFSPPLSSSVPVSLSPPLSSSSSVHIPLFMLRHTLCLHLLPAIYSSPYLSTHSFLTFPSPLLSAPLSICSPQEMVSFPKGGWGG